MSVQNQTDPLNFVQVEPMPTFLFLKRCASYDSAGGKKKVIHRGVGHHVWRM